MKSIILAGALLAFGGGILAQTPGPTIDALAQNYHARGAFDGVILVAKGEKISYRAGFGKANRKTNQNNVPETIYPFCSITKQFTALLVMQEIERGRLSLDGKISDSLPDFRTDTGSQITLKNLLSHTSGLPNLNDVPGFYQSENPKFTDPNYVVKTYAQGDLTEKPGEKFSYNNLDYLVLAAILERVTKKSYKTLLETRILTPLHMTHSGLLTGKNTPKNIARAYAKDSDEEPFQRQNFGAAGAMYGTIDDLLLWNRALDNDTLLSAKYRELMFTPDPKLGYVALSSWVYPAPLPGLAHPPTFIERQGAIGEFALVSVRAPAEKLSVIIFCNTSTSELGQIYARKGLAYDVLQTLYPADSKTQETSGVK